MKKKVSPGTKTTLAIAGLLSLAEIFYTANPTASTTVSTPIGIAARTDLAARQYRDHNVDTINSENVKVGPSNLRWL
jgi:hypothetical protein